MPDLTIRGLNGPHVIEGEHGESIVTLLNTPTITLPKGTHVLNIYKCKGRQFNKKLGKDQYLKGKLFTIVTVILPEEDTIYV